MYNELQKRYVKETKTNKEQSEAIKNLTVSKICRNWYLATKHKLLGRLKLILTFVKWDHAFLFILSFPWQG